MTARADRDRATTAALRNMALHAVKQLDAVPPTSNWTNVSAERANKEIRVAAAWSIARGVLQLVADVMAPDVDVAALQERVENYDAIDEQLGEFMSVAERAGAADATDPSELEELIVELRRQVEDLKTERRQLLDEREAAGGKP